MPTVAARRGRVHALTLAEYHPDRYDLVERNLARAPGLFRLGRAPRRAGDEWRAIGQYEGEDVAVRGSATFRDAYVLERLARVYGSRAAQPTEWCAARSATSSGRCIGAG